MCMKYGLMLVSTVEPGKCSPFVFSSEFICLCLKKQNALEKRIVYLRPCGFLNDFPQ